MDEDDDLVDRLIAGDPYAEAEVSERRMIPLTLGQKVRFASTILALSGLLAPLIAVQTTLITEVEPTTQANPYRLSIGSFAFYGVVTVFIVALFLLGLRQKVIHEVESASAARKIIRIEDIAAWFLLLGTAAIVISLIFAVVGIVTPETILNLTEQRIRPYRPAATVIGDVRLSSLSGAVGALFIVVLDRLQERQ